MLFTPLKLYPALLEAFDPLGGTELEGHPETHWRNLEARRRHVGKADLLEPGELTQY